MSFFASYYMYGTYNCKRGVDIGHSAVPASLAECKKAEGACWHSALLPWVVSCLRECG
jgi:hypothetical protein